MENPEIIEKKDEYFGKKEKKLKKIQKIAKRKIRAFFLIDRYIKGFLLFFGIVEEDAYVNELYPKWTAGLLKWFIERYVLGFIFNWSLFIIFGIPLNPFTPLAYGILIEGIIEFRWKLEVKE